MRSLLKRLFIHNWQRKSLAFCLAIIIWLVVNHSLTNTKVVTNVPVRFINLPAGKTVEGLQGKYLSKKLTITLVGNSTLLDSLQSSDLEVEIDASAKPDEWVVNLSKKDLISLNPEIDIQKGISKVYHPSFIVKLSKIVTEKIPVTITHPQGEPPRGYQFLDVWPYELTQTVTGPEDLIRRLKNKGIKVTFNLSEITKAQLDSIPSKNSEASQDEISYPVPESWKEIRITALSAEPIPLNDPLARAIRIDFVRKSLLTLDRDIPMELFFPLEQSAILNPENTHIKSEASYIKEVNGITVLQGPFYAKGISNLFLDIVKDMLQLVVIVSPNNPLKLGYSIQFINPQWLEDRYVTAILSDATEAELRDFKPSLQEEYLRNRFRSYMNHFMLYQTDKDPLKLQASLQNGVVQIDLIEPVPYKTQYESSALKK